MKFLIKLICAGKMVQIFDLLFLFGSSLLIIGPWVTATFPPKAFLETGKFYFYKCGNTTNILFEKDLKL